MDFNVCFQHRPHSLMDRTRVCGTRDPGSTPGEGTDRHNKTLTPSVLGFYIACLPYSFVRATCFMRRDFFRAAVFFLITPRFAALSIA